MTHLPDAMEHGPPETREAFREVAASRGFVSNLLRSLGHSPQGLSLYTALGHYARYGTALTEIQRELVICGMGRGIPYAWAHHAPMAIQAGLSDAQMAAIREGRTPADLPEADRAVCDFTFAFGTLKGVPDEVWNALNRHFTPRQATDIALLAAYYFAAASLIMGLDVAIEPPELLAKELAWQREPRDAAGQVQGSPAQAGPARALAPTMSRHTASDGIRLSYRVDDFTDPWRNRRHPVLLLHPAMGAYRRWYAWIPILAREFPVISLELRGHGASEVPDESKPITVERLADDVRELLDALGVARVHLVGNSAGGYVGQRLAIEDPARIATLALFASTPGLRNSKAGTWPAEIARVGLETFIRATVADRFPPGTDPGLVDWFCRQTGGNDPGWIGRFVTHMASRDWTEDLPRITCPTLIVAPGHEPIGSHNQYERMRDLIPNAELLTYDGMPHNLGDAVPEHCARDVLAFLQRQGA